MSGRLDRCIISLTSKTSQIAHFHRQAPVQMVQSITIMFLCESQRPANRRTLLRRPRQRFVLRPDSFESFSGACEFLASSPNSALPQALFFIDLHAGPVTHRQYPPPLFEDAVSLGLAPFPLKSCEERAEVLPR